MKEYAILEALTKQIVQNFVKEIVFKIDALKNY
jgi:hypothetical protein